MSRRLASVAIVTLAAACQTMQVRPHGVTGGPGSVTGPLAGTASADPGAPGTLGGAGRTGAIDPRAKADGASGGEERRVCRGAGRPRGWIAVAYVPDDGACPRAGRGDTVYTAAVLTHWAPLPVGSTLDVCADQTIPAGWTREDAGDVGERCPGAGKHGASAVLRIRRSR